MTASDLLTPRASLSKTPTAVRDSMMRHEDAERCPIMSRMVAASSQTSTFTSFFIQKIPTVSRTAMTPSMMKPSAGGVQRAQVGRVGDHQVEHEAGGQPPAGSRPRGGPRRRGPAPGGRGTRARGCVSATVLSSSARLPPTSRWIRIAITTHSKSSLSIRSPIDSEGVLDLDAEAGLDQRPAELVGDRVGALADDGVDGLGQRQARREAARHQLQGVGELGVERLEPPACLKPR